MSAYRVSFSPGEDCLKDVISFIEEAESYLDVCVFTISDNRIARALVDAFERGIDVRVVTDNEKMHDQGSDIRYLFECGIPVRVDQSPYHMHHKFAISDNGKVLTGSYNWTRSAASYNHENVIIIENEELSISFADVFESLWENCISPD